MSPVGVLRVTQSASRFELGRPTPGFLGRYENTNTMRLSPRRSKQSSRRPKRKVALGLVKARSQGLALEVVAQPRMQVHRT